jgi:hypothetical protein
MDRTREPGKKQGKETRARLASPFMPLFLGVVSLLNGCGTWQKLTGSAAPAKAAADPLCGGDPAIKTTPTASAANSSKSSTIPAIPASNSSASNVAMTIGEPLPGSRLLAIDDKAKKANTWQGPGPGAGAPAGTLTNAPAAAGGVQLQRPEAVADPGQRPTPVPVPLASSLPSGGPSNDQLDALLKQRGVTYQHQEPVTGGIKLTCAVQNRQNPNINRFYEATAADYAGAIQAVLRQIDAQQGTNQ